MVYRSCLIFFLVPTCVGGNGQSRLQDMENGQSGRINTGRVNVPVSVPVTIANYNYSCQIQALFGIPFGQSADWITSHKKRLLLGALLVAYCAVQYHLLAARLLIRNKAAWCNWQDPLDAQGLSQMPPDVLYKLITEAIALRYDSQKASFITTIGIFFADIDDELNTLRSFVATSSRLHALKMAWLFRTAQETIEQANMRIRKLVAMRQAVIKQLDQVKRVFKVIAQRRRLPTSPTAQ